MVTVERSEPRGHRQQIGKSAALTVGALALAGAALRPPRHRTIIRIWQSLPLSHPSRARIIGNKATAEQPPWLELFYKKSGSNERLRVSSWIVQKLYDYAVKKTVEL